MTSNEVWIVGCRGMLGTELVDVLGQHAVPCTGSDLECDITDPAALDAFAARRPFRWIINCSAYTAVDKAEDDEARAHAINAVGAGNLAALAQRLGARLIHLSTDYVFDGRGVRPYCETDPVCPVSAYGRTKAEGEQRVQDACAQVAILRTAWLYGRHGRNFVGTMLQAMRTRPVLTVVADQRGTPTRTTTLCDVITEIIARGTLTPGIYHVTDEGETSWYEFACAIRACAVALGRVPETCQVEPIVTAQYPTRACRPAYSVLSKRKIASWLGHDLPHWHPNLEAYLRALDGPVQ
jgi:dTDP-4-dehydrorhamnose reductase